MIGTQYQVYPGALAVLTRQVNYITTQKFNYLNQLSTTTFTGNHYIGNANLFMVWAVDADQAQKGNGLTFDVGGVVHALPHARYVLYDTDPDPKVDTLASAAYDNYSIRMDKNTYYVRYDALYGPIADTFQDYLRVTIFNDTFDAPLIKPTVT